MQLLCMDMMAKDKTKQVGVVQKKIKMCEIHSFGQKKQNPESTKQTYLAEFLIEQASIF